MTITKYKVRSSGINGQGTFALRKIVRGEFITKLTGVPITRRKLYSTYPDIAHSDDPLQIAKDLFLLLNHDAKAINHSCEPNCCLRHVSDLYAMRDIRPGEELTYDYATTVGMNDEINMACNCQSLHCRQQIKTNILSLPKRLLAYYVERDYLQDYILQQLEEYAETM